MLTTYKRMSPAALHELSMNLHRAKEIIRQAGERPEYAPWAEFLQRFIIIGSVENPRHPIIHTRLFCDTGHTGWYRTITNNQKDNAGSIGWYNGINDLAHKIPPPRIMTL